MVENFSAFIDRLRVRLLDANYINAQPYSSADGVPLQDLLLKSDLDEIYRYIIGLYEQHGEAFFTARMASSGFGLRVDKDHPDKPLAEPDLINIYNSQLRRTVQITIDLNGNYALVVHTGRKPFLFKHGEYDASELDVDANGKYFTEAVEGQEKVGIAAWRVDQAQPQELMRLLVLPDNMSVDDVRREVAYSQLGAGHPNVDSLYLGAKYINKHGTDVTTVYSPMRRLGSIDDYILKGNNFNAAEIQQIILDVLQALKLYHNNGLVHQDIKSGNVLLYRDETGNLRAALADFGIMRPAGSENLALATVNYASPQVYHTHKSQHTVFSNYYSNPAETSLGEFLYRTENLAATYNDASIYKPALANDMWAVGILYYLLQNSSFPGLTDEIFAHAQSYQEEWPEPKKQEWLQQLQAAFQSKFPQDIAAIRSSGDPLLIGLLQTDAAQRLTVDAAIAILTQRPTTRPSGR